MKLTCTKCGTGIDIPQTATTAAPDQHPTVTCPGCGMRYRLKPRNPDPGATTTSAAITAAPTSAPAPASPPQTASQPPPPQTASQAPPAPATTPAPDLPPPPTPTQLPQLPTQAFPPSAQQPEMPTFPEATPREATAGGSASSSVLPDAPTQATPARLVGSQAGSQVSTSTQTGTQEVFQPGAVLDERYRIVSFLAKGGMGEVYEAEDIELREHVALKTISADRSGPEAIDRFKREIQLARKVTHPNICRIFDLGQHQSPEGVNTNFLTMELLRGETLSRRLRHHGRYSPEEALPIAKQIAYGLHAAHKVPVVHRDLKSENIFLVPQVDGLRVVVTDFGIAHGAGPDDRFAAMVTGAGIVGTPAYMSPEQVQGGAVTAASDIYSLGIVLYEMVTAKLPFQSDNPLTTAVQRLQQPPKPPSVYVPDLDVKWEKAILRCLETNPDKRFRTAIEVIEALDPRQQAETTSSSTSVPTLGPQTLGPTPAPAVDSPMLSKKGAKTKDAQEAKSEPSRQPLVVALLVVLALSAGLMLFNRFFDPDGHTRVVSRRSVAVLGLENRAEREDADWMSTALAEMIGTELARGEKLRVIPGERVAQAGRELGLQSTDELPQETLIKIHRVLGCDFIVAGGFVSLQENMRLDLRLSDAALGTTRAQFAEDGNEGELFEIVRRLGTSLRDELDVEAGDGDDPLAGLPKDRQANRLYSEALDHLRDSQPLEARDLLTEAVQIEPANALLHHTLASTWQALGWNAKAAEHAERAMNLSSDLPREDRLAVEGRYHETRQDWVSAVEVYRRLWDEYPDDLEYGLRLTAAETSARAPDAASLTIEQLRALPPPSSEDPRIDLAEASVAAMLSDFPRQLKAAERAAEHSAQTGAALLEAQARLAISQATRFLGRSQEALDAAEAAHQIYAAIGHPSGEALSLTTLANAHFDRSEFDVAELRLEEAIGGYRDLGDRGGEASARNNLALILKNRGELERAENLYAESEQIYRETENQAGLANVLNNLGGLFWSRDQLTAAKARFEDARSIWAASGDRSGEAFALNNIAATLRLQGELQESQDLQKEALAIRREIGQRLGEVFSLINLGGVLTDLGKLDEAETLLEQGREVAAEMENPSSRALALYELAELRLMQDRLGDARELHEEALAVREDLDEPHRLTDSRLALVRLSLEEGDAFGAESAAREVIDLAEQQGRIGEQARASAWLGLALLEQQRRGEARGVIGEARLLRAQSEQQTARFWVDYVVARLAALDGRTVEALEKLIEIENEVSGRKYGELALEAHLARAWVLTKAGDSSTAQMLIFEVLTEAEKNGLHRLRRNAEDLLDQTG